MTPNTNATEWTIRVKKGITFHNGKTLDADDVIFTFQKCLNPKSPAPSASLLVPVELNGIKKLDQYTVSIPCKTPYSSLPQMIQNYNLPIMPVDFDLSHPVGTGPFKYVSFTPGVSSLFDRNPNYFETGLPYLDSVEITDFTDETAQTSALLSGQLDAIGGLSVGSVDAMKIGGKPIVYSAAGGITPFTMRTDVRHSTTSGFVRRCASSSTGPRCESSSSAATAFSATTSPRRSTLPTTRRCPSANRTSLKQRRS